MPPQSAKVVNYGFDPLIPKQNGIEAKVEVVNLAPSTTFTSGRIVGFITGSAADVQTLTETGSPGGGNFTLTGYNPLTGRNFTTAAIDYAATAATVQTELRKTDNFGAGNVTVSGSAGGPWTLTFAGGLATLPVPILVLGTNLFSGGSSPSLTIAHTTLGRTGGTYAAYDSSVATPPNVGTLSGTGTGGATAGGDFLVQLTGVNAQGETTPGNPKIVTLTSTQSLRVAAVASLDTSFTSLNVYVDGVKVGSCACSAGTSTQADFTLGSIAVKGNPPLVNTAYTIPNGAGTQKAVGALIYTCQTDAAGQISYSSTSAVGEWGQTSEAAAIFVGGTFDVTKLTGLDAKAVTDLGRLKWGSTTTGELQII